MKKSLTITFAIAALIVVAAFSTLAALSALAGEKHGLDCAKVVVSPKSATLCGR